MDNSLLDQFTTVNQLAREKAILEILQLMFNSRMESGKRYTIRAACREAGVDESTWNRWVQEGHVSSPLQKIGTQLRQSVYDAIIPNYAQIVENLVRMAMGRPPEDSPTMSISASDMRAAIKDIFTIIPPANLDKLTGGSSETEHLDVFQPQQVFINIQAGDFVYQGGDHLSLTTKQNIIDVTPDDDEISPV